MSRNHRICCLVALMLVWSFSDSAAEAQSGRRSGGSINGRGGMSLGSTWQRSGGTSMQQGRNRGYNSNQHHPNNYGRHHYGHGYGKYGGSVQVWVPGPYTGVGALPIYMYPSHASYGISYGIPNYQFRYGTSSTGFSYSSSAAILPAPGMFNGSNVVVSEVPRLAPLPPGGVVVGPATEGLLVGDGVGPIPTDRREVSRPARDLSTVVDEFAPVEVAVEEVDAADRVDSLRYQARGDAAMGHGDLTSALVFYQTAANRDPLRQAAWLRVTWVHIARNEFAESASSLKRALEIEGGTVGAWVAASALPGVERLSLGRPEKKELWQWLSSRPASTDRLLLTAAFMYFHDRPDAAEDMLNLARPHGLSRELEFALKRVAGQLPEDDANVPPLPGINSNDNVDDGGVAVPERAETETSPERKDDQDTDGSTAGFRLLIPTP